MYSFLVLGYVPGTNLQIGFQGFLNCLGVLLMVGTAFWLIRNRRFAVKLVPARQPLHATRLHRRG